MRRGFRSPITSRSCARGLIRIPLAWVVGSGARPGAGRRRSSALLLAPAVQALGEGRPLQAIAPTEIFFTYLKCALLAGFVFALPVIFWQIWAFVAPGLYPSEKNTIVPFVSSRRLLFAGGAVFGYTQIFPVMFKFFTSFDTELVQSAWTMHEVFKLTTRMFLAFGVAFELPVVVFFLALAGIVDAPTLLRGTPYAVLLHLHRRGDPHADARLGQPGAARRPDGGPLPDRRRRRLSLRPARARRAWRARCPLAGRSSSAAYGSRSRITRSGSTRMNRPCASTVTSPAWRTSARLDTLRPSTVSTQASNSSGAPSGVGLLVLERERARRSRGARVDVRDVDHLVERSREHRAVHAAGRTLVGRVEGGAADRARRHPLHLDRQRERVVEAEHHVVGEDVVGLLGRAQRRRSAAAASRATRARARRRGSDPLTPRLPSTRRRRCCWS